MHRRSNRELNIFSMSALDLFAAAMGTFLVVAVILFPYYQKNHEVVRENTRLSQELQASNEARRAAEQALEQSRQQIAGLEQRITGLQQALEEAANKRTALFGMTTEAKRFVVLVDMSGSINNVRSRGYNSQRDDYRNLMYTTFARLFESLTAEDEVAIIGFHAPDETPRLHFWPAEGRAMKLDAAAKTQAVAWLRGKMSEVDGGTPSRMALEKALSYGADAVILLSDGAPTVPERDKTGWQALVADITNANQGRSEIHAIAVGIYWEDSAFTSFLRHLVQNNNGELIAATP